MLFCFFFYVENETLCPFWKGTGGVLLEVVSLIKRLESDRQEAKEALQEERHTAERLRRNLDSLSLWKQHQFPVAVQLGPRGSELLRFVFVREAVLFCLINRCVLSNKLLCF